jgi:hypothetical protein
MRQSRPLARLAVAAGLVLAVAAAVPSPAHADYIITTFDPPGSAGSIGTQVQALNASGVVAGYYRDATTDHGFIRDAGGTITAFDPPGSIQTVALALNAAGAVAGYYSDST